jgi:hypothetical protein
MSGHRLPLCDFLHRVSAELGVAADNLAMLESVCAPEAGATQELQTFDKLGQTLRALEVFLCMVALDAEGEIDVALALPAVPLEGLRAWLSGATPAPAPSSEPDLW